MSGESSSYDKKSLLIVTGKSPQWDDVARHAIAFANAKGGVLDIGIEDDADAPPPDQQVDAQLPDRISRRIRELTVNVEVIPVLRRASNGGAFVSVQVPRSQAVASSSKGSYFIRVGDESRPVLGDDVLRLANERASYPWETLATMQVPRTAVDADKLPALLHALRDSDRVKEAVKRKSDDELLEHYLLADGPYLTNLGVLCVGRRNDRARLGTAPVIQALKFDAQGHRINKWVWDDYTLSPMELVDAVWQTLPDFQESYELPEGLLRHAVPAYDARVVRELLVNALVHRPYTQRGDIFLNLHPDRLEVVNPGRLPIGVTPQTMLHKTVRRNDLLARLFHDLKLMEREGTGIDMVFEVLLAQGRPAPERSEGDDSTHVTVSRLIVKPEWVEFMARVDQTYQLDSRERIVLGLLVQHDAMKAADLMQALSLPSVEALKPWFGRLRDLGLVESRDRTRGTRYFVPPAVLERMEFRAPTTLARIEPHRLDALILEDLGRYPASRIGQIHARIGTEIARTQVEQRLKHLIAKAQVLAEGEKKGRTYRLTGATDIR
jgi:ATP-dependent DNA helicase RecG